MIAVNKEVRMIPVKKGKIDPDLQALCTERINILSHKIPSEFCIRDLVIRELRIPQCKAFMVFYGQNGVFESRLFRYFCPLLRIKQIRVKVIKIFFISFNSDLLQGHYPLMSGCYRKKTKMNKHTETVMDKPVRVAVIFRPLINVLTFHSHFSFHLVCYA